MYVSVDHEKHVFLHKHPDYRVVANLDFIANRSKHTSTGPISNTLLDHFALDDLQKLFRNTTAKEPPTGDKETLAVLLTELATYLPETECDPAEVERQAAYFEDKFEEGIAGFCYMRGSNTPEKGGRLPELKTEADPVALLQGARQSVARKQLARQALYNRVGATPIPAATPSDRTSGNARNAGAPAPRPRSGVCGLIHDALDECYKTTGLVPTREQIKALAAEKGWNPSTAGVQYGAWRKAKNLP